MFETPDATLWFRLYDANLNFLPSEHRGGDDQELVTDALAPGEYYLQVVTSPDQGRTPDGLNLATVVLRAEPEGYRRDIETAPVSLGSLGPNQSLSRRGSVVIRQRREISFNPTAKQPDCPNASGAGAFVSDMLNEYVVQAPAGQIGVSVSRLSEQNWPAQYPFRTVYLKRGNIGEEWLPARNGRVDHPGGELRIRLGHSGLTVLGPFDAYVDYLLEVRAGSAPSASNPQVIQLPPFEGPTVTIGP